MTDHRFLSEDRLIQEPRFASGAPQLFIRLSGDNHVIYRFMRRRIEFKRTATPGGAN